MIKRKWIINMAAMFLVLLMFFVFSGSYYESCVGADVTISGETKNGNFTIYIPDENTSLFKSFQAVDGTASNISVLVKNGNTVDIPITVYIDYNNDSSVLVENYYVYVYM